MADDTNPENKDSSKLWVIVGIIVVAILLFLLIGAMTGDEPDNGVNDTNDTPGIQEPAPTQTPDFDENNN